MTHDYLGELLLDRPEDSTKVYSETNVRVTGRREWSQKFRWNGDGRLWCDRRRADPSP